LRLLPQPKANTISQQDFLPANAFTSGSFACAFYLFANEGSSASCDGSPSTCIYAGMQTAPMPEGGSAGLFLRFGRFIGLATLNGALCRSGSEPVYVQLVGDIPVHT
jgi:hypothetical protein